MSLRLEAVRERLRLLGTRREERVGAEIDDVAFEVGSDGFVFPPGFVRAFGGGVGIVENSPHGAPAWVLWDIVGFHCAL